MTVRRIGRLVNALAVLCLLLAAGCMTRDSQDSPLSDDFDRAVAPYVAARSFSGSVLVVRNDSILHHAGYGFADLERDVPNEPDTRFRIGSMTKSFTAAAILLLEERGEVSLDDPASRFVDGFPFAEITIDQLLTHTSGLARFVFQPDYNERSGRPHSTRDLVDWIANIPAVGEPGERFGYSNANYSVLAHIIEQVSGVSYGEFIRSELLEPLELTSTGDAPEANRGGASGAGPVAGMAVGYHPVGLRRFEIARPYDYSIVTGAGSMYSTTVDVLAWFRSRDTGQLGYAWDVSENLGREAIALSGWDGVGFGVRFVHYPVENTTVVVLANLNMSSIAGEVADQLSAIAFGEPIESFEVLEHPMEDPDELRREYAGTYRFGTDFFVPNATIEFVERDGQLLTPAESSAPEGGLLPLADGTFIHRQQWFPVTFRRDSAGAVMGIRYDRFEAIKDRAPAGSGR